MMSGWQPSEGENMTDMFIVMAVVGFAVWAVTTM